jgi:hypothetical protein
MSGQHLQKAVPQRKVSRSYPKDFSIATPEEFVRRFGGDRVVNKVLFIPDLDFYMI